MCDYIKGTVTYIKNNAIVIETGGVGYLVYVANPYSFEIGKELRVYVYQQVKEDEQLYFQFKKYILLEKFSKEVANINDDDVLDDFMNNHIEELNWEDMLKRLEILCLVF